MGGVSGVALSYTGAVVWLIRAEHGMVFVYAPSKSCFRVLIVMIE